MSNVMRMLQDIPENKIHQCTVIRLGSATTMGANRITQKSVDPPVKYTLKHIAKFLYYLVNLQELFKMRSSILNA
jgi:hypothetical protein